MNDMGTINYANGNKYEGEFKYGKCYGTGTFYYAEGTKYIGEFKNGEMNGKGTYFNIDGSISYKGEWKNNNPVITNPCNSEIKNTTVNSNEYIPEVIFTNIIGGSVENRQLALQNLKVDEIVKLIREPNNTYDKDAIAIYNKTFEMLGYISKDNETDLAKAMDNGVEYECVIISKSGGNGLNYGANIQIKKLNIDPYTNNNCKEKSTHSKSNVTNETILFKVFSEKIYINEPDKQNLYLSEDKQKMIGELVEGSAQEFSNVGFKKVMLSLNQILEEKKQREGTDELYELSLKRNSLFYMYKWGYTKKLLKLWIDYNLIPDPIVAKSQLDRIRENSMPENIGNTVALKTRKPIQQDIQEVLKCSEMEPSQEQRIDNLEFDYKFANVRDDILFSVMLNVAHNKEIANNIFNHENSDIILNYIELAINTNTSMNIGNMAF